MKRISRKLLTGYQTFRQKYATGDQSVMQGLADYGQQPEVMVVACCDSRVDPAVILQCDPGDLFVVRNIASIVPPYQKEGAAHGTSAALEFGIRSLQVKHLILLGHSQCAGIQTLLAERPAQSSDFIDNWMAIVKSEVKQADPSEKSQDEQVNEYVKQALQRSYQNCLTFPWIQERVAQNTLTVHLWFFAIKRGEIFAYSRDHGTYTPLTSNELI